jgi:hypothetical protein
MKRLYVVETIGILLENQICLSSFVLTIQDENRLNMTYKKMKQQ